MKDRLLATGAGDAYSRAHEHSSATADCVSAQRLRCLCARHACMLLVFWIRTQFRSSTPSVRPQIHPIRQRIGLRHDRQVYQTSRCGAVCMACERQVCSCASPVGTCMRATGPAGLPLRHRDAAQDSPRQQPAAEKSDDFGHRLCRVLLGAEPNAEMRRSSAAHPSLTVSSSALADSQAFVSTRYSTDVVHEKTMSWRAVLSRQ